MRTFAVPAAAIRVGGRRSSHAIVRRSAVTFEVLYFTFMFLGSFAASEGSEVSPMSGVGINFA